VIAATYPSDLAALALRLFIGWFGPQYARSVAIESEESDGEVSRASLRIGRRWGLEIAAVNLVAADATVAWEAGRAAIERRLDDAGHQIALWVPRGASLPAQEPGLSQLVLAIEAANTIPDGRREVRRPVELHLRRTSSTGSVITVLGGLAAHWAQFTNRVPGSFQLNSSALFRLPSAIEERTALADAVVRAAGQPTADESETIIAQDCWTATTVDTGRAQVIGSPARDDDESASALRRNLRRLLKVVSPLQSAQADARALVVLGSATYAEDEKVSWALRGVDPLLYAGFDIVAVIADGVVRPLLRPSRSELPWDAPLPSRE
jgi:hypothetical protein